MERFTFTDTDADMDADTDTRTFGHPLSMTDDPKIFTDTVTDTDTDTRTCRHSLTVTLVTTISSLMPTCDYSIIPDVYL